MSLLLLNLIENGTAFLSSQSSSLAKPNDAFLEMPHNAVLCLPCLGKIYRLIFKLKNMYSPNLHKIPVHIFWKVHFVLVKAKWKGDEVYLDTQSFTPAYGIAHLNVIGSCIIYNC